MTNPIATILRPVKDKIVRAVSGSNVSQDAMNLALMNQRMGKGLISDKFNLINYNSNIASELGIKARADQQRAIEAEGLRQEAAKKVQPTVGYRESTPTKPDPLEGRRYVVSKPTKIITPPMFDPSKHKGANTSLVDWDQTSRNANVTGVSGYDLPIEIVTPGGYEYALDAEHIAKGIGGASGKGIANKVADRINISSKEGADKGGTGEALSFVQTMGEEGANFSSPIPQFMFDMVNHRLMEGRITQKDADYITKLIQTRNPKVFKDTSEFAGFNDLGWEQFHTGVGLTGTSPGKLRTAISDVAQMETVQKLLGFNIADFKNAITADKLKGVPKGNIGSVVIQAPERGVEVIPNALFPYKSPYSSNFTGTGIAQFPEMMNSEALFYRVLNPIKEELLGRGSKIPYTSESLHRSALGALGKRKDNISQIIDPRFEDDYGNYFNELLKPNEYKEGGEVPHMMGGGGAKSKNAPKFTEAFTQGLGPMLYGAARGTAAGLAGIGGDIEELARLGINYAGDKLQGRFPNMLDKRDVVGAKATLPTSERVLSKIPSLKDFGPEARHSEDIAAKLGMYGLSNIAAPKVGKAVVQGVNATGKALAPKAGEMLENYMVRTGGILPMDVWHGSPHRFPPTAKNPLGEFDPTKIGTGEGAQAYGHGHYLAEAKGTATGYRDTLAHKGALDLEYEAGKRGIPLNREAQVEFMRQSIPNVSPEKAARSFQNANIEARNLDQNKLAALFKDYKESKQGSLYKVDLPDEQIAKMLDWDKPLSEQADVIKALKGTDYEVGVSQKEAEKIADMRLRQEADEWAEMTGGDPIDYSNNVDWEKYVDAVRKESGSIDSSITGKDLHRMVMRDEGYRPDLFDPENYQVGTSQALRGMGIPGIRYLDQGSRDAGEGTRNFVVFPGNEEMLNILSREKDGGLVHGKKNGGESKKPFSNDFERRQQMSGSVMPSQREMEEALRPATVNSLLKRAADRRQGKAMQEEPESPEVLPEAEVRPSDPTFRQNKSANIQQGLEALGFPIPRARSLAQNIMGEGGTGILDVVPFVGTPMSLQETKRAVERARDKGDQTGVATELGLGALTAAAGLWGTKALAKNLASRIKKSPYQRYSQADYDRILREGELKQLPAPPAPPKLLNGPTEQLLLNAPKREKTVFEMQQELAQKNAMLPKSQYGLELPPGNTAAQRLEAMGFDTDAYHATDADIIKFDNAKLGTNTNQNTGGDLEAVKSAMRGHWFSDRDLTNKDPRGYMFGNVSYPVKLSNPKKINDKEFGSISYVVKDPDDIRSRFAAGDPFRRNAAVAAATGMAAPDLLAEEYANGGQVTSDDLILIERRR